MFREFGKPIIVKDVETWADVEAYGTYEADYKNGELYSFNGKLYYLSHLELSPKALRELNEYHQICYNIF